MAINQIISKIFVAISDFENDLCALWEQIKPYQSVHYVITLDRIANRGDDGLNMIRRILAHKGLFQQIEEWIRCGIINEGAFDSNSVLVNEDKVCALSSEFKFLPIDTRYFKDIETDIIDLFPNLNEVLDGWLIKSDNWQALNTILPTFRQKVQCIYIDPPFNKNQESDYDYSVRYDDVLWNLFLRNRIILANEFLKQSGSIFVRCDYRGNWLLRPLLNNIFGRENFRNEIVISAGKVYFGGGTRKFNNAVNYLLFFSKGSDLKFYGYRRQRSKYEPKIANFYIRGSTKNEYRTFVFNGESVILKIRNGHHWKYSQEAIDNLHKKGLIIWRRSKKSMLQMLDRDKLVEFNYTPYHILDWEKAVSNNWTDIAGFANPPITGFETENTEILLKRVIESTTDAGDLVMDFFLGSGTTVAAAHKLRRRWIGIEVGNHFYSVILPRMKRVLAYDKSGISKEKNVKEKYNAKNAGGFFKYCELTSYSDIIENFFVA